MKPTWTRLVALLTLAVTLASCDAFISVHQRMERAQADLGAGKWGSAAIELRRAIQKQPNNAQAWLLLARLSLDAGDAHAALGNLGHAAKDGAKGRELDVLRVRAWLGTNQPKMLLAAAAHHELSLPEPALSIAVAQADIELERPKRALALLNPILAAHPGSTKARLAAAQALARTGKLDMALQQIDTAMENDQKSAQPPLMKAELLNSRGQFAQAESAFSLALTRMAPATSLSERAAALAGITESRLALGKVALASKSERALEKLVPTSPAARLLGARIKLIHGDFVDGIADLQRLVVDVPGDVEARLVLGAAQLSQGSLQQAQQNLERVVREAPDNVEARKLLASVRLKLNQPEEALRVLTPALGGGVLDPQLIALFGTAAKRSNNPEAALDDLKEALLGHPNDATLRLNLAQVELVTNHAADALQVLEGTKTQGSSEIRRDGLLILAVNAVKGPVAGAAVAEKLVHTRPHDVRLLDVAATYFLSQGAVGRARALLEQARTVDPHDPTTDLGLARVDLDTGNVAAAVHRLRAALSADPQNVSVRLALANVLARERAFVQAEQVLEAAGSSNASSQVPLALASVYFASGNSKKANAALDRATALDPRNPALWSAAGAVLMKANQYDAALARFRKATELAPSDTQTWLDAGKAELALNQPLAARNFFNKALKIEPESLAAVTGLTLIDLNAKDFRSALARVRQYVASHPNDPNGLSLEGEVDMVARRFSAAASAFEAAQKQRPEAAVAVRLFQVRAAQHSAHPQEPLEKWLDLRPNDTAVRTVLGDYYLGRRMWREAAQELARVVKQSPTDVVALNNLAWVYNEVGDPRAVSTAKRAYSLAPGTATVLDTYAWVLAHHDRVSQALPLISKAAKAAPTDPDIQYHYAYILERADHPGQARKVLTKLLAGRRDFGSRGAAKRLLAKLKV